MSSPHNLHPIFDRLVPRVEKERQYKQKARVVWLFGLSGSGKSTLAVELERRLFGTGHITHLLDGDNIRTGLNKGLGFTDTDRDENLRRVAEVAKLFVQAGVIVICSFITPARKHRALAKEIIGAEDFLGVYVQASFETCAQRDPKGLYAKARSGNVAHFTGKDSSFETPLDEEGSYLIDTETEAAAFSSDRLSAWVAPRVQFS